jgi:hypothetical protein
MQAEEGQTERLRLLLMESLPTLERKYGTPPEWLAAAVRHRRVLSTDPASPYVNEFLRGETLALDDLKSNVEVPAASWFWGQLTSSLVRSVSRFDATELSQRMAQTLRFAETIPRALHPVLAACLDRAAEVNRAARDDALLKFSLERWGSPQLHRNQLWSGVSKQAKQMVCGWLAKEDLEDFYLLCKDRGDFDERRLEFWLRFKDQMTYTMILLGTDLRYGRERDVKDFVNQKGDRLGELTQAPAANNAILMCIGNWLFVEFSMKDNACFGFPLAKGAIELGKKMYALVHLKQREEENLWLPHKDDPNYPWEERFFDALAGKQIEPDKPRIVASRTPALTVSKKKSSPDARSSPQSPSLLRAAQWAAGADRLVSALKERGIEISDRRVVGGTVWVLDDDVGEWEETLRRLGMKYKQGKGFYL